MTDQQTTAADDMAGSKSRHPAYRQRATIDREAETRMLAEIGAAWEALPDDSTGDHDTLADAIRYLVADRDAWRLKAEAAREDSAAAWRELPDDMRAIGGVLFGHVRTLAAERDELQALVAERLRSIEAAWAALRAHIDTGPHETLADAIGALAGERGDGWRNALETVSELMAEQADASAEFQVAYVVGLLSGLLAVDRG
jgi:hypothetical protein